MLISTGAIMAITLSLMSPTAFNSTKDFNSNCQNPEYQPLIALAAEPTTEVDHTAAHAHHDWRSVGKPGSSLVQLQEEMFATDAALNTTIDLQLLSPSQEGTLRVSLRTDSGLNLVSSTRQWTLELGDGKLPSLPVTLNAERNGTYHLHLVVEHLIDQQSIEARALAAEVQVGPAAIGQLFEKSTSGPQIVSLPARETIR